MKVVTITNLRNRIKAYLDDAIHSGQTQYYYALNNKDDDRVVLISLWD